MTGIMIIKQVPTANVVSDGLCAHHQEPEDQTYWTEGTLSLSPFPAPQ